MVGRDAKVRIAALNHVEHALQHADDGTVRAVRAFIEPAQSVEVTEELVCTINEVDDHLA